VPLVYEATISCNKEECKTDNLTSIPFESSTDAAINVESKALNADWVCEVVTNQIYWCPEHLPPEHLPNIQGPPQ